MYLDLLLIRVEDRKRGKATAIMQELCSFADKHNLRLRLEPSADFGSDLENLCRFYEGCGFHQVAYMERVPKSN